MSEKLAVETVDLKKTFFTGRGNVEVLKGVNIRLRRGEMLAVTGASGVGKTTLLHIIGGIERVTSGRVLIDGEDITEMKEEELARIRGKKTAFVFQFYHLLPDFTVLENVMMPGLIRRLPHQECRKKALQLLEEMALSHRIHHFPSELSGGEQQRVAIARALMLDPVVLLADEPTGNLDPGTAEKVFEVLLQEVSRKCITLILATHNMGLAKRLPFRAEMVDGRLTFPEGE